VGADRFNTSPVMTDDVDGFIRRALIYATGNLEKIED